MNWLTTHKTKVRRAAVAGRFYPGDPAELRRMIEGFLGDASATARPGPKAVIAPHAGYVCSGPIAASAYAQFGSERGLIKRVVLLGPSHYVSFQGLAVSTAEGFATPLGIVAVDTEAIQAVRSLPQLIELDEAHEQEHSLEVHLPFLQVVLEDFKIVPLVVGEATEEEVCQVIERLWGGPETRFVISSDLSHYHDYQTAQEIDRTTAQSIERLCPEEIGGEQACGRIPMCGLLSAARHHGLHAQTVALRNSGDTGGPAYRVVGYGAFAFREPVPQAVG